MEGNHPPLNDEDDDNGEPSGNEGAESITLDFAAFVAPSAVSSFAVNSTTIGAARDENETSETNGELREDGNDVEGEERTLTDHLNHQLLASALTASIPQQFFDAANNNPDGDDSGGEEEEITQTDHLNRALLMSAATSTIPDQFFKAAQEGDEAAEVDAGNEEFDWNEQIETHPDANQIKLLMKSASADNLHAKRAFGEDGEEGGEAEPEAKRKPPLTTLLARQVTSLDDSLSPDNRNTPTNHLIRSANEGAEQILRTRTDTEPVFFTSSAGVLSPAISAAATVSPPHRLVLMRQATSLDDQEANSVNNPPPSSVPDKREKTSPATKPFEADFDEDFGEFSEPVVAAPVSSGTVSEARSTTNDNLPTKNHDDEDDEFGDFEEATGGPNPEVAASGDSTIPSLYFLVSNLGLSAKRLAGEGDDAKISFSLEAEIKERLKQAETEASASTETCPACGFSRTSPNVCLWCGRSLAAGGGSGAKILGGSSGNNSTSASGGNKVGGFVTEALLIAAEWNASRAATDASSSSSASTFAAKSEAEAVKMLLGGGEEEDDRKTWLNVRDNSFSVNSPLSTRNPMSAAVAESSPSSSTPTPNANHTVTMGSPPPPPARPTMERSQVGGSFYVV